MSCNHPPPSPALGQGKCWQWLRQSDFKRVFHLDRWNPEASTRRTYGPIGRFDHHESLGGGAQESPSGRSVIYLGDSVATCALEVFCDENGTIGEVAICPRWTVAEVYLAAESVLFQDLRGAGAAELGALGALASGQVHRSCSQEWARAIYDQTPYDGIVGVLYNGMKGGGDCLAMWDTGPGIEVSFQDSLIDNPTLWSQTMVAISKFNGAAIRIPSTSCRYCLESGVITPGEFVPLP
jgi:hypothetical protein